MDIETLDEERMKRFIVENGWSDLKGKMLYPGWNMPCNQKYNLSKRLGIDNRNEKSDRENRANNANDKEEVLMKREEGIEIQEEQSKVEKMIRVEKIIKVKPNKYFDRNQYFNYEYERIRRERTPDKKERTSTAKKERKERKNTPK